MMKVSGDIPTLPETKRFLENVLIPGHPIDSHTALSKCQCGFCLGNDLRKVKMCAECGKVEICHCDKYCKKCRDKKVGRGEEEDILIGMSGDEICDAADRIVRRLRREGYIDSFEYEILKIVSSKD